MLYYAFEISKTFESDHIEAYPIVNEIFSNSDVSVFHVPIDTARVFNLQIHSFYDDWRSYTGKTFSLRIFADLKLTTIVKILVQTIF